MPLTVAQLIGYQRAEYDQASRKKTQLLLAQFGVAIPAAVSIFFDSGVVLYFLAVIGVALLGIWWALDIAYERHRAAGELARRATLIVGGLGQQLSSDTALAIREAFAVTEEQARQSDHEGYYAAESAPGPHRLGEMIEESAFWTTRLQTSSAHFMLTTFAISVILLLCVAAAVLPYTTAAGLMISARVLLTVLVFVLSSDVLGVVRGHWVCARDVKAIQSRLATAAARNYPEADVLLAMADYNAAVEAAPMVVPWVYRAKSDQLNALWASYRQERASGVTPPGVANEVA